MTLAFAVKAYGRADCVISQELAAALRATGLVRVELGPTGGVYTLHGQSAVGVAAGPGWELRVESHLDVDEVMFLLSYARDPKGWRATHAYFDDAPSLFAAVAHAFAAMCEEALRAGPLRGYRRLEEDSPVLRGRLRVGEHVARGGLATPVLITRDEYDLDIPENRLLVAAARLLTRVPLVHPSARARLRHAIALLDEVSDDPSIGRRGTPRVTRLNMHYGPALAIAELVLRATSLSAHGGSTRSVTFAFELHRVLEDFLEVALGAALRARGLVLRRQPSGRTLDAERWLNLYPDFVVERGRECVCVLDAKFKRLAGGLGGDAYQMLAYLLEFGPRFGALVAADGLERDHTIRAVDKVVGVRPLRLDRSPKEVLEQVDRLAHEVAISASERLDQV